MEFRTADQCDQFADELEICDPLFRDYGGRPRFAGVTFRAGEWLYADEDGVLLARRALA